MPGDRPGVRFFAGPRPRSPDLIFDLKNSREGETMGAPATAYRMNQYAPAAFQGVPQPPAEAAGYDTKPYDYIYSPPGGLLTADQVIENDQVSIQPDSDFILAGWYISQYTGAFQIQLTDSAGYQMMSGFLNSGGISLGANNPTVFSPAHMFPAGGRIQVSIQDLSGLTNPLQIVFKGWKRFRLGV
jgi:hypothetical protein